MKSVLGYFKVLLTKIRQRNTIFKVIRHCSEITYTSTFCYNRTYFMALFFVD